jgi:hypothetical protein
LIQTEHPVLVVQETRIELQERDQITDSMAVEILIEADLRKKSEDLVIEIAPIADLIVKAEQIEVDPIETNQIVEEVPVADLGVEKTNHQVLGKVLENLRAAGVVPKDLLVAGVKEIEIQVPVVIAIPEVAEDLMAVGIQIVVDLIKMTADSIAEMIQNQVDLEKNAVRIPEARVEVSINLNLEVNENLKANRIVALVNPKPLRRKIISKKHPKDIKAVDALSARFNNNRSNLFWPAKT